MLGRLQRRLWLWLEQRLQHRVRGRSRMPRRGELPSTREVRRQGFGPLELEVYRLQIADQEGFGLSAYIGIEELLRFDCLGEKGHFHVNLQQSRWVAQGQVQRLCFQAETIAAQLEESIRRLELDLPPTQSCNWRSEVRAARISSAELKRATDWARAAFSDLTNAAPAQNPNATGAAAPAPPTRD